MSFIVIMAAVAAVIEPKIVDPKDPYDDARSAFVAIEEGGTTLGVGCFNVADRSSIAVLARFERIVGRERPGLVSGGTPVQYRFDSQPAQTERWTSQRYNVRGNGASAMRFILAMKGTRQIFMRARREDGDVLQISFNYTDPTRLIDDVLARCGYNPDGSRSDRGQR